MPELRKISNNFFTALITRLGVLPPFRDGFELINVVQPVSLVDADVSLPVVVSSITLGTPSTAGYTAAPAAGTVLADTGGQVAGIYFFLVTVGIRNQGTIAADIEIQRRDAANATTIWSIPVCIGGTGPFVSQFRASLNLNERLRVIEGTNNAGAGSSVQANIWSAT
jgi:hypothetical protein